MKNSSKVLLILVILLIVILALSTVISATYKPDTFKDRINTEAGGASSRTNKSSRNNSISRNVNSIRSKIYDGKCRRKSRIQKNIISILYWSSINICSIKFNTNYLQLGKYYLI